MNKASKKYGIMWKDLTYVWQVYLNVMEEMNPSWKTFFRILSKELPQPSKAGQHSSPGYIENTTKKFLKKRNPQGT